MHTNNFDTSSTGVGIELHCEYDCGAARGRFEEGIAVLQPESYHKHCIAFYTAYGEIDAEIEYKVKGLKSNMVKYLNTEVYAVWDMQDYVSDMRQEIIDRIEEYDKYNLENYNIDLAKYNLEICFKNDLRFIEIRGYSQGDYAKVICDFTQIESVWGTKPDEDYFKKELVHLFYDQPVYARFDIEGKEYSYYEYLDDEYAW